MSKAKAVAATIRLVIPAGQAKPSPPVGPALGQAGLKIMDFCKDFNAKTADYKVSVHIRNFVDGWSWAVLLLLSCCSCCHAAACITSCDSGIGAAEAFRS